MDRIQCLAVMQKGRNNLLLMLGLTLVNIVLYIVGAALTFPFSAFLPQMSVAVGLELYYELALAVFPVGGAVIAALLLGFYGLCYFLSARRPGWLIAALVLFALDTVVLLVFAIPELDLSAGIDIAFHGWVLYYLIRAVSAISKLKALPEEPEADAPAQPAVAQNAGDTL